MKRILIPLIAANMMLFYFASAASNHVSTQDKKLLKEPLPKSCIFATQRTYNSFGGPEKFLWGTFINQHEPMFLSLSQYANGDVRESVIFAARKSLVLKAIEDLDVPNFDISEHIEKVRMNMVNQGFHVGAFDGVEQKVTIRLDDGEISFKAWNVEVLINDLRTHDPFIEKIARVFDAIALTYGYEKLIF